MNLELNETYNKAVKKWPGFPKKFDVDQNFAISYIEKVKNTYIIK
jgi:hypothetical protein